MFYSLDRTLLEGQFIWGFCFNRALDLWKCLATPGFSWTIAWLASFLCHNFLTVSFKLQSCSTGALFWGLWFAFSKFLKGFLPRPPSQFSWIASLCRPKRPIFRGLLPDMLPQRGYCLPFLGWFYCSIFPSFYCRTDLRILSHFSSWTPSFRGPYFPQKTLSIAAHQWCSLDFVLLSLFHFSRQNLLALDSPWN